MVRDNHLTRNPARTEVRRRFAKVDEGSPNATEKPASPPMQRIEKGAGARLAPRCCGWAWWPWHDRAACEARNMLAREALRSGIATARHALGKTPMVAFEGPLSAAQAAAIKEAWREAYEGPSPRGIELRRRAVLPNEQEVDALWDRTVAAHEKRMKAMG